MVFTIICFFVTISFQADVDAQGGSYATRVPMSTLSVKRIKNSFDCLI